MTFYELEYLVAIDKYRNISRAAEACFVSQPTLSKFLSQYEKELGVLLFERCGKKILPTYAGQRQIVYAKEILNLYYSMRHELGELASQKTGSLAVGYQFNRSSYMTPATLPAFKRLHPLVDFSVTEGSSEQLTNLLLDGSLDLVIYNSAERSSQLEYETLYQEEVLLLVPQDHPLSGLGVPMPGRRYPMIDLKLFADTPFILQQSDQSTGQLARKAFERAGISPPIAVQTRSIEGTIRLVEQKIGCAFVIETHLKYMMENFSFRCFSLGIPRLTVELVAAHRKGNYFSKFAQDYIAIIQDSLRTNI